MRSNWNVDRPNRLQFNATLGLIVALGISFVLHWLPGIGATLNKAVAYDFQQPWTLLTYVFDASMGPVGFLFLCWWLYMLGSYLEASLGRYGFLLAFFGAALASSILMTVGLALGVVMGVPPSVGLPVSALTVLWGARNQTTVIKLFALIPIMGKWVAALSAFVTVFSFGYKSPLMGVLAGAPLLFMWLYGTNRIKFMRFGDVPSIASAKQVKKETKEFDDYMDKVREREHKRKEKDKLREMLESSLQDEDDKEEES